MDKCVRARSEFLVASLSRSRPAEMEDMLTAVALVEGEIAAIKNKQSGQNSTRCAITGESLAGQRYVAYASGHAGCREL